jgi:hypothetical protein
MNSPIVSLAGPADLHDRAERYNRRLSLLHRMEDDLDRALEWNDNGRIERGWFGYAKTHKPIPTSELASRIEDLRSELIAERAEIVSLSSEGTVKP